MKKSANLAVVVAVACAFVWVAVSMAETQPTSVNAQEVETTQVAQPSGIEYAELRINDGSYVFETSGSTQIPRTFSLNGLYRNLGGRSRNVSRVNLLGVIGEDGWQIVDVSQDRSVYTFAR